MAENLKLEMPPEYIDFVLGRSKVVGAEWSDHECRPKKLSEVYEEPIREYFYTKMDHHVEHVRNDHSFSMAYEKPVENGSAPSSNWLELNYDKYGDILSGFSGAEFCDSMYQILASTKTNNELQNELFELLGFEAFELISEMLDNRRTIVDCGLGGAVGK